MTEIKDFQLVEYLSKLLKKKLLSYNKILIEKQNLMQNFPYFDLLPDFFHTTILHVKDNKVLKMKTWW